MPSSLQEDVKQAISEFDTAVQSGVNGWWFTARTPVAFRNTELDIAARCRRLQDAIVAAVLVAIVSDADFEAETYVCATHAASQRYGRRSSKTIKLLGGGAVRLNDLLYVKPNYRGKGKRRGPKRKRRGKNNGVGFYPALAALGIEYGVTPALGAEVVRQVADSDSVRAGRSSLARRDIDLGHKQTLKLVNVFSARAIEQRNKMLESARRRQAQSCALKGRRVFVSTDGGRTRHRKYRPGRPKKNGHRNYDAPWQEPKLLVIYTVDEQGKVDTSFQPIYDGTLNDCEAIFDMLVGYLRALGVHEAKELIIVADGAKWIWERAKDLIEGCEIDESKVSQVVDWYHAVQKLHAIAGIPKNWDSADKAKWIKKAKRLLYAGKTADLEAHIESLATGRRAKAIRKHIPYFSQNAHRMQYKSFTAARIPIGSGAMESAVRRIINLRMKSNAKFWLEVNAEGMIMVRSYLKAGRFDDLINWSISSAAWWWTPEDVTDVASGGFSLIA